MHESFSQSEHHESPVFGVTELLGRRDQQQDAYAVLAHERGHGTCYVVCDGHGREGERVAKDLSILIAERLSLTERDPGTNEPERPPLPWTEEGLKKAFQEAHLFSDVLIPEESNGGTTATVALIEGRRALIGYVGNSTAVFVRTDGTVARLFIPHELDQRPDERARIEQLPPKHPSGHFLRAEDFRLFVYANGWRMENSRSLGDTDCDPYISHEPDVVDVPLPDDATWLILATDGFWELWNETLPGKHRSLKDDIRTLLPTTKDPHAVAEYYRRALEHIAEDNLTVIFVPL